MAAKNARYKRLKTEIASLQQLADSQKHHYKSSKAMLYEGLSRVYMWWKDASKEKGLLEKLYDEYEMQYKTKTMHDIQFSPLLRYLWNMDGSVNSNTIDQWNRALNNIHTEVQINKEFYKTKTLDKLVTLIHSKKGITELAGYFESNNKSNTAPKKKISKVSEQKLNDAHLTKGKIYFASSTPSAKIKTTQKLTSIDNGLSLALLRKCSSGYEVVSAVEDETLVDASIVKAYKRTSTQLPNTIRLITEIIRSQLLPTKISKLAPSLSPLSKFKHDESKQTMKQLKRLLYVGRKREFVLSENRSACSVVTTVKPNGHIFKAKEKDDLALNINDRTYIENNLIHTDNFNFYTTDAKKYVTETTDEVASYKMKLENTVTRDYRFIRFYSLSTYNFPPSRTQAVLKDDNSFKAKYKAVLNVNWINEMSNVFLSCWVNGYGLKMKRDEHKILKLSFGKAGIAFSFVHKAGKFKEVEVISFDKSTASKSPFGATVLSKDIIPVLNALTTMEINGNVKVIANDKLVKFMFKTGCAEYCIAVPFCNEKGKRFGDYMEVYGEEQ